MLHVGMNIEDKEKLARARVTAQRLLRNL
jgi:hypothetical protein